MSEPITAILPAHIDSTMLTAFRQCPRKFYHEFILGLRPPGGKSIDLHAGACFASALERIYRQVYNGLPLDLAISDCELFFHREWGDVEPPLNDKGKPKTTKTRERVWAALEAYIRHWGVATDPVQPYVDSHGNPTFEHSFSIPLDYATTGIHFPHHPVTGDPFIFAGRFDLLGHMNGVPAIRDEKTTKSIGQDWAKQWDIRGQFLGYKYAMQLQGIKVGYIVVRGVGILATDIKLVEIIKTYNDTLLARWIEQTRRDLERLVTCWQTDYWDYNMGDACNQYGRCQYTTLCTSPDPTRWMGDYRIERWNPVQGMELGDN